MPLDVSFRHRIRQLAIRAAGLRALLELWQGVDPTRLPDTIPPFTEAAGFVVTTQFTRSAAAAADYYERIRPPGITTVEIPEVAPPPRGVAAAKLRGAGLAGIVRARRAGFSLAAAAQAGFVRMSGTASGLILDGSRQTILQTAALDPASSGRWRRVASGNACPFCQDLAGRGFVYSDDSADFSSHDHCACQAEPEFL